MGVIAHASVKLHIALQKACVVPRHRLVTADSLAELACCIGKCIRGG
jgi:hypothetical protein